MRRIEVTGVVLLMLLFASTAWNTLDRRRQHQETRRALLGNEEHAGIEALIHRIEERTEAMLAILEAYRQRQAPGQILEEILRAETRIEKTIRNGRAEESKR